MTSDRAALLAQIEAALPDALDRTPPPELPPSTHDAPRPALQSADLIVRAAALPDMMQLLRDTHGYTYLSHITPVDYIDFDLIEVIYAVYHLEGGGPLTVRVRVPRQDGEIPSITPWWPGADLQEREVYDLYGVRFPGHPYHHRLYMWDEFVGHPMLKDFQKTGDKYTHVTGGEE